jgi:flagellar basal-body rod protein FlgB
MKMFDSTKIPVLGKALDAYALRQRVIASNISNISTIGYKSKSVAFEEQMVNALQQQTLQPQTTTTRHIDGNTSSAAGLDPVIVENPAPANTDPLLSGVNNVDIDMEMADLAKNQIRFKFATRMLSDTFRGIQKSIRGTV